MNHDEHTITGGGSTVVEELFSVAGDSRAFNRVARRGRTPRFPPNLAVEDYRRLLIEHVEALGRADTTDAERAETAKWRQAVIEAPADELRAELGL
jgi:hypothetical protein